MSITNIINIKLPIRLELPIEIQTRLFGSLHMTVVISVFRDIEDNIQKSLESVNGIGAMDLMTNGDFKHMSMNSIFEQIEKDHSNTILNELEENEIRSNS